MGRGWAATRAHSLINYDREYFDFWWISCSGIFTLLRAGAQGKYAEREGALSEHSEGCIEIQADPEQKQSCP